MPYLFGSMLTGKRYAEERKIKMTTRNKRGRPIGSRNVRIVPIFRAEPDIEKFGRALISLATYLTEKEDSDKTIPDNDVMA